MHWRLLVTPPRSAAANMATDAAMLAYSRATGEAVARVYAWQTPSVSFGIHQTARGVYDPHLIAADGYEVVRRPTGGRALLHHREITYAITAPITTETPRRETYRWMSALIADALRGLGVPVTPAPRLQRATAPGAAPCFDAPAEGELAIADRKLVGSAQVQRDGAVLQHGSILIDNDQPRLLRYLLVPAREVPAAATLRELLGMPPTVPQFAEALSAAIAGATGSPPTPISLPALGPDVFKRELSHFADPGWTWSR
jgi:lipoate-protein ligase A